MTDHLETYSSANLRVLFMNDERGNMIKTDSLYENLYDFGRLSTIVIKVFFIGTVIKFGNLK